MFEVNRNHEVITIYSGKDANDNNDVVDINGINNDGLAPVKGDEAAHHEEGMGGADQSEGDGDDRTLDFAKSNLPNYVEYVDLIRKDYEAYIIDKGKGKMQEKEVFSDDEVLNATFNSSDNEEGDELLEFNAENEMEKPELVVGQLLSNVTEFREAVRPKKLRRKGHDEEGAASCNRVNKKRTPMHCNHCSHTDHNVRGTDSSNLQDIDIGSNPNIGSLDGGRDHVEEQDPIPPHMRPQHSLPTKLWTTSGNNPTFTSTNTSTRKVTRHKKVGVATSTIDTASESGVQMVVVASRITRSSVNTSAMRKLNVSTLLSQLLF
ncbi:hypothetical protein ACH5RR_038913 [Cinchona calisaya]|uniref:Uncharacterized protein n=1 Tax=Cinchona calisaya TaxID=153742 RepID=A0ABD2XZN9_9GENT